MFHRPHARPFHDVAFRPFRETFTMIIVGLCLVLNCQVVIYKLYIYKLIYICCIALYCTIYREVEKRERPIRGQPPRGRGGLPWLRPNPLRPSARSLTRRLAATALPFSFSLSLSLASSWNHVHLTFRVPIHLCFMFSLALSSFSRRIDKILYLYAYRGYSRVPISVL